jgi:DNA-binding transcriptional ArsR family regulator
LKRVVDPAVAALTRDLELGESGPSLSSRLAYAAKDLDTLRKASGAGPIVGEVYLWGKVIPRRVESLATPPIVLPNRVEFSTTVSSGIDTCLYRNIMFAMARAATTADAFNAVAEPRRRQLLDVLAGGERPVNDLVARLGLAQPQVSKHLRVLREVGLVEVREEGRQRMYRLNGQPLKPIHDWVKDYERTWSERFDRLDVVLEELKKEDGEGDGEE